MKFFLFSAALALAQCCSAPAMAEAAPVSNGPINILNVSLSDITSIGAKLVAVGERGLIMQSGDQGGHWSASFAPTSRTLTAIAFVDSKAGVAVGHGGTVLRTEDAGLTWLPVAVAEIGKDAVLGVTVLPDGRLIAYGAFGMYIESFDKGKTWKRRPVISDDFDRHISRVIPFGDSRLLLVGESGTLAVSPDNGATWKQISSPYVGSYFGALVLHDGALLAYGMRGNVFRSEDQGQTWDKIPFASTSTLNGGTIDASGKVTLVGNNGLIATSTDNGHSFSLQTAPRGTPIAQAVTASDGVVVYVGYLNSARLTPAPVSNAVPKPAMAHPVAADSVQSSAQKD